MPLRVHRGAAAPAGQRGCFGRRDRCIPSITGDGTPCGGEGGRRWIYQTSPFLVSLTRRQAPAGPALECRIRLRPTPRPTQLVAQHERRRFIFCEAFWTEWNEGICLKKLKRRMIYSQSYGVHEDTINCSKAPYKCWILPCACQFRPFQHIRKDLSTLKVYAIDVDEADELDDALSATRLPDGRIKVWIHVADPTCLVKPRSIIDREAMHRGTSIFLPTATIPMFPERLAMNAMSLQQGKECKSVTVSVVLNSDGSIAEYTLENSVIKPTYMLTYESATELLYMNLEEEEELRILREAAFIRAQWRHSQGSIDTAMIEPRIKVSNPDDPEPNINLYVEDQANPAMQLVSEMMILCGEAVAAFGSDNNLPLPYRGHPQSNTAVSVFSHLPEGPARSFANISVLRAAEMDFQKPVPHGVLGIPGYVQFTSPIRRYVDLLAHYQVKAFLRGDSPPYSAGDLEGMTFIASMHVKVARRLHSNSLRYWLLEYLRRQPKGRKYRALILKFIKDRMGTLLLVEVGMQVTTAISRGKVGDEVNVTVETAHPRDDILSVREVVEDTEDSE